MPGIADKFDYVLTNYGYDVIVRKVRSGNIEWERHTTRSRYPAVRGLPDVGDEQEEGLVHNVDMLFYFRANADIREGDRIYEQDPRYGDGRVDGVQYVVDFALANRGIRGEVSFYTVGVTRDVPN